MKTNSRLTIAVHALVVIYMMQDRFKLTGDVIAKSEQVNPVIVRGVLSSLKKAGLVEIPSGKGGARAARPAEDVTLYDVYAAVNDEEDRQLFGFHSCEKSRCPIACNMHNVLDRHLSAAEDAVRNSLSGVTMQEVLDDMQGSCGVDAQTVLSVLGT